MLALWMRIIPPTIVPGRHTASRIKIPAKAIRLSDNRKVRAVLTISRICVRCAAISRLAHVSVPSDATMPKYEMMATENPSNP